ncbi:hypothetical protein D9M69_513660 [compost metagenome]
MVGNQLPDPAPARQRRLRRPGIRWSAGRRQPRPDHQAGLRRQPGHRRALHQEGRASPGGDPPRAGRQRPGGNGRRLRPRRLRRHRRAHERHPRRPRQPGRLQGPGGLRRLLLRRRARRRRGLGQVHPLQHPCPRRLPGLLRAQGQLRPRRVQRLPDDVQPARADSWHRVLAALRAQPLGAVRSSCRHGPGAGVGFDLPARHGRFAHAHRHRPR